MSPRELVQAIEKTEGLIGQCMREQGFQYIAADHNTVRAGMSADKRLPGLSEEEFVSRYGFGVSTFYTGLPPQLVTGYSPARVGLGERNVQIFRKLSPRIRSLTIARCLGMTCPAPSRSLWRSRICRVPVAARARLSLKTSSLIS